LKGIVPSKKKQTRKLISSANQTLVSGTNRIYRTFCAAAAQLGPWHPHSWGS